MRFRRTSILRHASSYPIASALFILLLLLGLHGSPRADIPDVSRWAYQLQGIDPAAIATNNSFELIVIDYSSDGTAAGEWTPAQIDMIRQSGKLPIAYISIGEAEDYRYYWDPAWVANPPSWLGETNPDWPGNYKVRFWDPAWQEIIFDYLSRITAQGFVGIYMDIVDGYYYWSEENPENPQADADMANFILAIGDSLRTWGGPDQVMIPQNGCALPFEDDVEGPLAESYWAAIDAIGIEDVFFYGEADEDNPYNPDQYRLNLLAEYRSRGKDVFSVEYLTQQDLIDQYIEQATLHDFVPYVTTRPLDTLMDGIATAVDLPHGDGSARVLPVWPNPSSSVASFGIDLPVGGMMIVLSVYDLSGRLVGNSTRVMPQGRQEMFWQPEPSLPSGVYLYRLSANSHELGAGKLLRLQ